MEGMKVVTFVVGTAGTLDQSFSRLDQQVEGLGKIRIHSITDSVLEVHGVQENDIPRIARVVVYEPL